MSAVTLFMTVFLSACMPTNPPAAVLKAFEQAFPKASDVSWGKENDAEYEAEFKLNDTEMSANFSPDGTWLETESSLAPSALPSPVSATIKTQYPEWKIAGAERVDRKDQPTVYEVIIRSGMKKKELLLQGDGTFDR